MIRVFLRLCHRYRHHIRWMHDGMYYGYWLIVSLTAHGPYAYVAMGMMVLYPLHVLVEMDDKE